MKRKPKAAYMEGRKARRELLLCDENPYDALTQGTSFDAWLDGYVDEDEQIKERLFSR